MPDYCGTRIVLLIALTIVATVAPSLAFGADWPGWRGPRRDGVSRETGLLQEWPEGGPSLVWATNLCGEGYATPAVAGNRVYMMGNGRGGEWVVALNVEKKGTQEWASATGSGNEQVEYPGARSTPTVDSQRVYALGVAGILVCLDAEDGKVIWHKNLVTDFGGTAPNWGYSESVLVDGKFVICTPGGRENTLVALNKDTGQKVWGAVIGDAAAYSSVIKVKIAQVSQYVAFTAKGVVSVAADSGRSLWRYDAPAGPTANIATPIWYKDTIFAASAYKKGGGLVWPRFTPQGFVPQQIYFTKDMQNHHGGMVLVNEYLFGCGNPSVLTCLNYRTGEIIWTDRSCGKCSILHADRRLYCRDENGPISLVADDAKGFNLHGRFTPPHRSGQKAWPHLVVANGMMYVRDQNVLLCYDVRDLKIKSSR